MQQVRTKNRLNCFCSRKPLLAMYGIDHRGKAYVHCRVFKQNRIYGDWIAYDGEVKILCRECLRWLTIVFVQSPKVKAELHETEVPTEVSQADTVSDVAANLGSPSVNPLL